MGGSAFTNLFLGAGLDRWSVILSSFSGLNSEFSFSLNFFLTGGLSKFKKTQCSLLFPNSNER